MKRDRVARVSRRAVVAGCMAALARAAVAGAGVVDARVRFAGGVIEGTSDPDSGIRAFKGIPYAAPPVGDLRWKPPQPVRNWDGVRKADRFGPRAMQAPIFDDMVFRSNGMSEDCLYLNVWTPAKSGRERLPVLVYFYGGGFQAGDGSESRYDGESMASRGIVAVTVTYRLNVFGFLAHPELTKEWPQHASGNYGLLDQNAALRWVQRNIAAFGGNPRKVTIAGESAGSISVTAQMASPLSKDLIAGAIGESGALIIPTMPPFPLAAAEAVGVRFAMDLGVASVAALRAMPSERVLEAATGATPYPFLPNVDGYFLQKRPVDVFAAGEQAHVPLLVGWNSAEGDYPSLQRYYSVLRGKEPTPDNYAAALKRIFGDRAEEARRLYAASTPDGLRRAAAELADDQFIGYGAWKWSDLHGRTGGKPVYRYLYTRPLPPMRSEMNDSAKADRKAAAASLPRGAVHAAEIEYALGNLETNKVFAWTPDDYKVSGTMQGYFANFVKTGDPNGPGLPTWPAANRGSEVRIMRLDVDSRAEPDRHQDRYRFLDQFYNNGR